MQTVQVNLKAEAPKSHQLKVENPLFLECGDTLQNVKIRYTTFGKLNKAKTNVVWVFHALTANSNPIEWWPAW